MSKVVEHLAELTGYRDRDVLDVTLVTALKDLLRPSSVSIVRCVGEPGDQRWLTRARLLGHEATATADPLWSELESLPKLEAFPARQQCLQSQRSVVIEGAPAFNMFPLSTEHETVGVLEVETPLPMNEEDVRLVSSILRIYRNFQGLLDYSERDTLTGLLNRKTFDESFLRSAMAAANGAAGAARETAAGETGGRRGNAAAGHWLGVIDIDHFKRVNDGFGHLIGDEVLLLLSRLMRGSFRFHDMLYRFGGEEFVVLMRCDEEIHAGEAFERLRVNTERYAFPQVGRITVSIGFTEVRAGDSPAGAFERADKAVYHAKGHGRNQVHNYAALVASGVIQEATQLSDVELF